MGKIIIGAIIILLAIGVYYWLRKTIKIKKRRKKIEKFLGDSDFQRLTIISSFQCLECGECVADSKSCCCSCVNFAENNSIDTRCREHNHDHYHHHHSSEGETKGLLLLVLIPLMVGGLITYRIIKKTILINKQTKS